MNSKEMAKSNAQVHEYMQLEVTSRTVRNRLSEAGLISHTASKRYFIRPVIILKRFAWDEEYIKLTVQDLESVLCSDEALFNLFSRNSRASVRLQNARESILATCNKQ